MTEQEMRRAYLAMLAFLEAHYNRVQSDAIGSLLGDMSLLEDGGTADPAVWQEWLNACTDAEDGNVDALLRLKK